MTPAIAADTRGMTARTLSLFRTARLVLARSTLFESLLMVGTSSSRRLVALNGLIRPAHCVVDLARDLQVHAPASRHRHLGVHRRVVVDVAAGRMVGSQHVEVEAGHVEGGGPVGEAEADERRVE